MSASPTILLFVVFKCFSEWTFNRLRVEYTKNPFITLDDHILSPITASYTQQAEDASPENETAQWNQPDLNKSVNKFPADSNLDFNTEVMNEDTRPFSFSSFANKKKEKPSKPYRRAKSMLGKIVSD